MIPALVMTGPGDRDGPQHALAGAVRPRFLAHAGHQEDRVVDPQRDQEDEGEGRDRRVEPGVAHDEADEQDRDPERAEEAQDHARDQHQRRHQGPQQDREDDRDQQQRDRRDQLEVALRRLVEVVVDRRRAADQARRRPARPRPRRRGASGTTSSDSDSSGSVVEHDVDRGGRAVLRGEAGRHRAGDALARPAALPTAFETCALVTVPSSLRTSTVIGASVPCGNASPRTLKPVDGVDLLLEERRGRVVDLVGEDAERAGDEDRDGDDQRERGALQHLVAEAAPDAHAARRRRGPGRTRRRSCRGQNPRLPKIVSSAGSRVRPATIAQKTPIAAVGPSELVLPASASRRTSIASVTVRPLARIAGPERVRACAIASCLSSSRPQLLAVSRDEQQAVVGPHAEHQHHEDAGAVRGDGLARLGQQVDEGRRDRVGEEDDDQRAQRDQDRPVDRARAAPGPGARSPAAASRRAS